MDDRRPSSIVRRRSSMRLVTYNIRGGLGMDGRRSTGRIAEILREIDADIICLQEVHRRLPWSAFRDQPAILRRLLDMAVVFQSNYHVGIGGFGNAVVTRLPVISHTSYPLPNPLERRSILRSPERRGLLAVGIETPGGRVTVLTTHWSLDSADRKRSAAVVAARIQEVATPVILCGDFNAEPASDEVRILLETTGLLDSACDAPSPTYPADSPRARIDYVYHSPAVCALEVRTIRTQASDHLPLVLDW